MKAERHEYNERKDLPTIQPMGRVKVKIDQGFELPVIGCRLNLRSDAGDALGDSIYEGFLEAKGIEWSEYRRQVHAWEIERYMPVF